MNELQDRLRRSKEMAGMLSCYGPSYSKEADAAVTHAAVKIFLASEEQWELWNRLVKKEL